MLVSARATVLTGVLALLGSQAEAKTDIKGCTSFVSIVSNRDPPLMYNTVIWFVPDTLEICEGVDCGGGRAPPKSVPGCPLYKGTETVTPKFLASNPFKTTTASSPPSSSSLPPSSSSPPPSSSSAPTAATTTTSAGGSTTAALGSGAVTSPPPAPTDTGASVQSSAQGSAAATTSTPAGTTSTPAGSAAASMALGQGLYVVTAIAAALAFVRW